MGFDLEQPARAKEKTVLRISNKEELSASPSPASLWSAKEAAYKSVSSILSGAAIRQISVFDWKPFLKGQGSKFEKHSKSKASLYSKVHDCRFSVKPVSFDNAKQPLAKVHDYCFSVKHITEKALYVLLIRNCLSLAPSPMD